MATITLHDVPEKVLSQLKQRAQARGRSLNSEMLDCLQRQASGAADVEEGAIAVVLEDGVAAGESLDALFDSGVGA